MQHISSHRTQYSTDMWVKLLPTECTRSICISCSSSHEWLWSVLNPTHLIFVYLIRFIKLAITMHQRWFLFIIFILHRITQGSPVWSLDYPDDVLLHSHASARVGGVSSLLPQGMSLLARRIDVIAQSPTAHPRKRLGRAVVDSPQTIAAETRGEMEGYTPTTFSL